MSQPLLDPQDVLFRWPGQAAACLDIARFQVAANEHVFIHGESGSGKSTLLNLIAGVLLPCRFSRRRRQHAGDMKQAAATLLNHLGLGAGARRAIACRWPMA